ncbi:PH domain-containing protein [Paenarthrobacter sp. DKR-5]|uniref:PH domain-containing protein n=1 Tax=Paenarthrobacter sp. DKR-5 TaxID=2835535 RepID=UPI001BDC7157|nr:PH domain-containing protein [Paenarthrobacter sp. DKR-5]MBT1002886.1 PH domain-containing protein [Paenarthrobacter sp. DKR-5]
MSAKQHDAGVSIFTARSSRWLAGLCWLIAAAGLVLTLASHGVAGLWSVWPLLLLAYAGWALFWHPAVIVAEQDVVLRNPLRTISVPWAALVTVDTKHALTLVTPGRRYVAWAAPAPGILGTMSARRENLRNLPETTYGPARSVRPGDLSHTDSGQAARLVRDRWERKSADGSLLAGEAETTPVHVRWNWLQIAAGVVLAAASAAVVYL